MIKCLILPVARSSTRVAGVCLIAAIIGLKGRVGVAGSANPANVCLALRIGVKAAIRPASGVAGAPCPVGVRTDAGQGQRGRDENDCSHERLLGRRSTCVFFEICVSTYGTTQPCPANTQGAPGPPVNYR